MLEFVLMVLLGASHVPAPTACTIGTEGHFRDTSSARIIARATPDSVLEGLYHYTIRGGHARARPGERGRLTPVYGQVFDLRTAKGAGADLLAGHRRIVVIWWSGCGDRWPPPRALGRADSELFLTKEPRDPSEWVNGLPTFDIEPTDMVRLYFPVRNSPLRSMSVAEYAGFYELLPLRGGDTAHRLDAFESLLLWGAADPERWRLLPARWTLCWAAFGLEAAGRPRPAAWLDEEHCADIGPRRRRRAPDGPASAFQP